jgi:RNA polymerase sigma factor (sigma-70 family)
VTQAVDPFVAHLAAEHGEDLLRFIARRARSAADARDIAQEVYVRLLRMDRKDRIRDPRAYLYRIAVNLVHEFDLKRRVEADGLNGWTPEQVADEQQTRADRGAEAQAIGGRLREVLGELSAKCRAVVILHRRDGLTCDEIGARLNISRSMVKRYLAQGLRHCCQRLDDFK